MRLQNNARTPNSSYYENDMKKHKLRIPKTGSHYLVIAGIHPSRQLVYRFIQAGFVVLHIAGSLRVAQVVDQIRADLQPPGHVFLQHLLVKIVHVVIVLHRDALCAVLAITIAEPLSNRVNNTGKPTEEVEYCAERKQERPGVL